MRFKALKLQNFMSFQGRTSLGLDNLFGLYLLSGENRDSEGADSNGAGKSAILESLLFVLYGKTTRGIAHDEVINRTAKKDCLVRVAFETGVDNVYEVVRARKHSSLGDSLVCNRLVGDETETLTASTMAETQEVIDSLIGLNFKAFTSTVLFGQGARSFVDFKDTERKALLTEVLGYDLLDAMLAETGDRIKNIKEKISGRETKVEVYSGQISELELEDYYTDKIKEYEREREAELGKLERTLSQIESRHREKISELGEKEKELEEAIKEAEKKVSAKKKKRAEADEEAAVLPEAKEILEELIEETAGLKARRKALNAELDDIDELGEGTCPRCYQPLDADKLIKRVSEIGDELKEIETSMDSLSSMSEDAEEAVKAGNNAKMLSVELFGEIKSLGSAIQKDKVRLGELAKEKAKATEALESDRKVAERQIGQVQKRDNPYILLKEENEKKAEVLRAKVEQLETSLSSDRLLLGDLVAWEVAFGSKGIRSQLFDRLLDLMDQKVYNYMTLLSEGAVSVSFDTEEELKGGGTRDKFTILVSDEHGVRPYEAYSGGEKKRIKLAVNSALSDIVCEERERTFDLVLFDEVLGGLDADGRLRAVELWGKQIDSGAKRLIIASDHSPDIQEMFDSELKVVKENGASTLII